VACPVQGAQLTHALLPAASPRQLAGVFQFRKNKSEAAPAPWQAESAQQRARAISEAAVDEQRRQEQQAKMLQQGGAADLAVRLHRGDRVPLSCLCLPIVSYLRASHRCQCLC
jgi:hypothetical protein